ncbi:MAG: CHAT domain-containing protein [Bryobacteraceae bacterium]
MDEGKRLRAAGKLSEAIRAFGRAAGEAKRSGHRKEGAVALVAVGGCEIRLHRYSAGFKTSTRAKDLALQAGDLTTAGRADVSISTIYTQLGDFEGAKATAEQAADYLQNSPRRDYFAMSLTARGEIEFGLDEDRLAKNSLRRALAVAKEAKDEPSVADIADRFGIWLVLKDDLKQAEALLMESFEIRKRLKDDDGLAVSYEHLAELESKKGKAFLHLALQYVDKAFATPSLSFKTGPTYYPLHIRARILRDLGKDADALASLRQAVDAADTWRQSALPGDATNIRTVQILSETYHDFADLAAEQSIKRGDQTLAREALEVLARNRAASLREQLTRAYSQRLVQSPEYFPLLSKLQEAQARATLGADEKAQQSLAEIRSQLNDVENRIGIESQNIYRFAEKTLHRNSLRDIQTRLGENEALLSFSLGEHRSFLWAVTKGDLKLYELPDERTISGQIPARVAGANPAFRMAQNDAVLQWFGRTLFGKVDAAVWQKHDWLITPDGKLLDSVPFPALRIMSQTGGMQSLIADRNLRFLPSELLLLSAKPSRPASRFIGVGDPIYNFADSRSSRPTVASAPRVKTAVLGRLVASDKEVTDSAQASGEPKTELLKGANASGTNVRQAVGITPEILHFAVHVVSPEGEPAEAALALSIDANGVPELLTSESVATYRVPGTLVVLSGCSTQQGRIIPGAGLVGLSRAWLLAGASAVVVSSWPTPDGSRQFFSNFYTHYKEAAGSIAQKAAKALQQTQLDMQRDSDAAKRTPAFWAAYSIVSKE